MKHGLWQTPDEVEAAISKCKSETAIKEPIKILQRFRKVVLQQKFGDKSVYQFSTKGSHYSSTVPKQNLLLLMVDVCTHQQRSSQSEFQLIGANIEQFSEGSHLVTYIDKVISQVTGFPDRFNVVYDTEPDTVYTYKLIDDLNNGDLKIV